MRDTGDVDVQIRVTGTVATPEIQLASSPNLPEDEILSRVLFGRSASQLGPVEAAQLAVAIRGYTSGNSFDLVGELQDAIGVDRLEVGVDQTGQANVGAGKYLDDNVYLEVKTGTQGNPQFNIEWTPRSNLEISTQVQSNADPKFSIQWKRDFGPVDRVEP